MKKFSLILLFVVAVLLILFICIHYWCWIAFNHEALRNIGLLVFALVSLPLVVWRAVIADKNSKIANKNMVIANQTKEVANDNARINNRNGLQDFFTRSVEQLGAGTKEEPRIEVRVGGIYALGQLHDHVSYTDPILRILSTYIRENAKIIPGQITSESNTRDDIAAAILIIGQYSGTQSRWIDLTRSFLPSCIMFNLNLSGALMTGNYMRSVHADGANFTGASLQAVNFFKANLNKALLTNAKLNNSNMRKSHLNDAVLQGADLDGVDLRGAKGLTSEQLMSAKNWHLTYRDEHLACGKTIPTPPD